MRLLLFNYEFPPIGGGGAHASRHLAEQLAARGHQVTVITAGANFAPTRDESIRNLTVIRLPSRRRQLHAASLGEMIDYGRTARRRMREIIAQHPADCVLSFFALPSGWAGVKAAQMLGCPHAVSLRGMDVPGYDPQHLRIHHAIVGPLLLRICRSADLLIPVSDDLREKLTAYAHGDGLPPFEVISNGTHRVAAAPGSLSESGLKMLAVGRLVGQKGHALLLEALADPRVRSQSWTLTLVGDGPLRKSLEAKTHALDLHSRVRFCGWQSAAQVEAFYAESDMLLHPSYDEGMSNVILEAMSQGLLAVASSAGGTPEVINDGVNGFLWDSLNPTVMAEKLAAILEICRRDPASITTMRDTALATMRQRSWDEIAARYEKALERLILCRGKGGGNPEKP